MQIIDAHCHYGTGDGLTGPWDTRASLKKYVGWARAAGIQQTVLFAPFNTHYALANQAVADLVQRYPQQFYGFVFVHPQNDAGQVYAMVKKFVQKYDFKGIKVHRHDGVITREICEVAKAFHLPILYDVMGEFWTVELLANEYPSVNFIIPHLGSFADDWRMQLAFIPLLERYPNIFTDTSGVRRFDLLERAVQQAGASKILFGTDGPWLHPKVELEKVFALKLSQADTQLIVANNFLNLIKNVALEPVFKPKKEFSGSIYSKNTEGSLRSIDLKFKDPWTN